MSDILVGFLVGWFIMFIVACVAVHRAYLLGWHHATMHCIAVQNAEMKNLKVAMNDMMGKTV